LDPTDSWRQQQAVKDDRTCCKPLPQISATQNLFILPFMQEPSFNAASTPSSHSQSSVSRFKISGFASSLVWLELNCKETESRMPLSGDKTNILLPKHFAGQSYELVFVFVSRLEDALIVIAEATPCRQDLRLRELPLSSCSKNRDCKVSLFLVLFVSLCVSLFIASPNSLLAYQGSWRQASHSICRPDSHRSSALPRNNQC
jgi:hypothetical protein